MKKFLISAVSIFSLTISVVSAQSVVNGINDIYAERYQAAKATFEKLVAANPNDIPAIYWLGQTLIGLDDIAGAKSVYDKGLSTSANAPLLLAGAGQVDLIQNRINEARQRFETAITMSGGKKGNDPEILNAVGRAITNTYTDKEKKGDINFAVQKLEEAAQAKSKDNVLMASIYVNLGNAYLKAKPGENGGPAFSSYQKALEVNPNFAVPAHRMARLFYTQRNWELYEKYLNDAITKDPKFAPAFYDLAYFKMRRLDLPAAEKYAASFAQTADSDPQNEYLRGSILYVQKKYDEAIAVANNIISKLGDKTKARVYKLLAYSYADKKDTATAKQNIDQYFAKVKPEEMEVLDYKLKADLYLATPGLEETAYSAVLEGVKADTVMENKIDLLKQAAKTFRDRGLREKEGDLMGVLIQTKPNPSINDMFDAGRAWYFGGAYGKSRDLFVKFQEKFPNEIYGYEWAFNNSRAVDTVKKDSIAVPDALKLFDFSQKDTVKFKKQYLTSAGFLVQYYANDAKDGTKALEFVNKMLILDPANETLKGIKKQLESPQRPAAPRSSSSSKTGDADKSETGNAGIKRKNGA
jgi:tetratricopeptide (TPR) repeat protein